MRRAERGGVDGAGEYVAGIKHQGLRRAARGRQGGGDGGRGGGRAVGVGDGEAQRGVDLGGGRRVLGGHIDQPVQRRGDVRRSAGEAIDAGRLVVAAAAEMGEQAMGWRIDGDRRGIGLSGGVGDGSGEERSGGAADADNRARHARDHRPCGCEGDEGAAVPVTAGDHGGAGKAREGHGTGGAGAVAEIAQHAVQIGDAGGVCPAQIDRAASGEPRDRLARHALRIERDHSAGCERDGLRGRDRVQQRQVRAGINLDGAAAGDGVVDRQRLAGLHRQHAIIGQGGIERPLPCAPLSCEHHARASVVHGVGRIVLGPKPIAAHPGCELGRGTGERHGAGIAEAEGVKRCVLAGDGDGAAVDKAAGIGAGAVRCQTGDVGRQHRALRSDEDERAGVGKVGIVAIGVIAGEDDRAVVLQMVAAGGVVGLGGVGAEVADIDI